MKRVSFNVAKAIKEAGFSQEGNAHSTYYDEQHKETFVPFECNRSRDYLAPTYMEVWLWLWNKGICIEIKDNHYYTLAKVNNQRFHGDDPEEVIIIAIEYLADNNFIE